MKILALDLGTHTGWASGQVGRDVCGGVYDVPKHERIGWRFHDFRFWLEKMLDAHDLVAYEKAYVMPRGATTMIFFGLIAILEEETAVRELELIPVNAMRLKKWTTGYGRASKAQMLDAVNIRWLACLAHAREDCPKWCPDPIHDQADALAIWQHVQELRANG